MKSTKTKPERTTLSVCRKAHRKLKRGAKNNGAEDLGAFTDRVILTSPLVAKTP
jgi:hypothetical protein